MDSSQGDRSNDVGVENATGGLDHRDIVGQSVGVVIRVIHDLAGRIVGSSSKTILRSHDHIGVGRSATNGAVSSGHNPVRVMDPTTAEMTVVSGAQRSLVWELSHLGDGASYDATFPVVEDFTSGKSYRRSNGCYKWTLPVLIQIKSLLKAAERPTRAHNTRVTFILNS